jgi:hypothetical protein
MIALEKLGQLTPAQDADQEDSDQPGDAAQVKQDKNCRQQDDSSQNAGPQHDASP